jgi:NTE family protein
MSIHPVKRIRCAKGLLSLSVLLSPPSSPAQQAPPTSPDSAAQSATSAAKTTQAGKGSTDSETIPSNTEPDSTAAAGPSPQAGSITAARTLLVIAATAATTPPPGPADRPRIGLALGGGGALGLSEIGVLDWFEDHHIPVDMVAGTSMGCMIAALYSTGKSTDQLKAVMDGTVFNSVFTFGSSYKTRNFRRREESRSLPNSITVGLKHGVSLRNSVLTDQGLNAFLDRQFLRYDDRVDFNTLPIPLRCVSTDLTDARAVTFSRGSIPNAIRASVSLPAVFRPIELDGHELVDGSVLDNLPTRTVRAMRADVVLAVSLPLSPLRQGDLGSIFGVLQRSFAVAIEGSEREARKLADVVIVPDVNGFSTADYLKGSDLAKRGYEAAEQHKEELLKYAVTDAQWQRYLATRISKQRGAPNPLLRVRVRAPNDNVARAVERLFEPLAGQPIDTKAIEAKLDLVRSNGHYDADYNVTYDNVPGSSGSPRPTVIVNLVEKETGPPFVLVGTNILAETGNDITRGTLEAIFLDQDFGGYGSELRGNIKVGFYTQLDAEYYRHLHSLGDNPGGLFLAPHGGVLREPFYIYQNQHRLSRRQLQTVGGGVDAGWSDQRIRELRVGWEANAIRWQTQVGSDSGPEIIGSMQRARIRFAYDNQDRALIPQFGLRATAELAYLYNAAASRNAPQFTSQINYSHQIEKNLFIFAAEGGTLLNRNVAQPFRFTLGGPLRLTASAIDEYRGTDYFLVEPAFLRRIAKLPDPLGQSIYIGAGYEAGQMRAPDAPTITRQDIYFGIAAETPLGVVTLAPAIGDDGHRKFVFTLGKLF